MELKRLDVLYGLERSIKKALRKWIGVLESHTITLPKARKNGGDNTNQATLKKMSMGGKRQPECS